MRRRLGCDTPIADPGCAVSVRYLHQATRTRLPDQVFAQLVLGFELAVADPRVVGINLVGPEDSYTPTRDYRLQMRMVGALHELHPSVGISLHAGELVPGRVPPEALRSRVRDAVLIAQARRIGHGISALYEDDPFDLLGELARRGVLVEICLSSNDAILEVRELRHPFPLYLRRGVPVTLATDDEGILRTHLSREYQRAVETYRLGYDDLKRLSRAGLTHSFLAGDSLWVADAVAAPCRDDQLGGDAPSATCRAFLDTSERARLQWRLEALMTAFEQSF